jgi:hypothetical protein
MRYARVENGQVVEGPMALPNSWKNISGLNLLSNEQLLSLGWLPWTFIEVPAPGNDWAMTAPLIEIKENEIVETQTYRQKSQEEVQADLENTRIRHGFYRERAYKEESDPLFFKAQRNEIPMSNWLAKVQEIKDRFPTD